FKNKLKLLDELDAFWAAELPLGKVDDPDLANASREALVGDRQAQARQVIAAARARWKYLYEHLDTPLAEALPELDALGFEPLRGDFERRLEREPATRVFDLIQDRSIRTSWKSEIRGHFRRLFVGGAFIPVLEAVEAIHKRVLRGRVWVALHMHAGDGNVHTNIPVNSDDYEMLQEANRAVARIIDRKITRLNSSHFPPRRPSDLRSAGTSGASSSAVHSSRCSKRSRRSISACCAAVCGSRCTCTRATGTCTRTFPSTPTTTRCCRRRIARSRASCKSLAA